MNWPFKMMWRERKRDLRALILLVFSIFTGVSAVVVSQSVSDTVQQAIDQRSEALLGADVKLAKKEPLPPAVLRLIEESGANHASEVQFRSMVTIGGLSKLAQVRAFRGAYPFIGEVKTTPPGVWPRVLSGEVRGALVDETLLLQTNTAIGAEVTIGGVSLPIVGSVQQAPGDTSVGYLFAPRVLLAAAEPPPSFLEAKGALADFISYLSFSSPTEQSRFLAAKRGEIEREGVTITTVEKSREVLGRVNNNLTFYFNLMAVIALALGGVGGGAGVHSFLKGKRGEIAVLKCLGATTRELKTLLVGQVLIATTVSLVLGIVLGSVIAQTVLKGADEIVRFNLAYTLSWRTVALALALGYGTVLFFSLAAVSRFAALSPLEVLRPEQSEVTRATPLSARLTATALGGVFLSAAFLLLGTSPLFTGGAVLVLGGFSALFIGVGAGLKRVLRAPTPRSLPVRLGFLRLTRPGNRTTLSLVAIGASTFLLLSTVLGTHLFRAQIQNAKRDGIKNLFVFDIQTDQEAPLRALFAAQQTEVAESVPIVLMRIDSINGKRSEELLKGGEVPEWTLRRDYWTTYREEMIEGEDLIAGEWVGKVDSSIEPIPISVEDELAKRLNLSLGGEVVWDVQGVRIRTVVKNLRNIHWERMRRNAFVVFPAGVLETAPQFLFFTAETKTAAQTATLQRAITEAFPNISIVDLRGIVSQVEGVLTSISHAVLLLSLLVGATGFVVVLAITLSGAGARRDEGVFLRTIGATKSDLSKVLLTEHLTLALAAVLAGAAAALVVLWAIARWGMKVPFTVPLLPLTTTALSITLLVVLFTLWANRKMLTTPCLEVLRR